MNNDIKQDLNVLKRVLSPTDFAPLGLMMTLSLYTLAWLLLIHFISVSRNGSYELSRERWIIIAICAVLVEILNQFTYWLAKVKRKLAVLLKGIIFWCIFSIGCLVYIYLLNRIEAASAWVWYEDIEAILIYLLFSWGLPTYSLSPNIRFFFLSGKFRK
jgi:hypothetical protein